MSRENSGDFPEKLQNPALKVQMYENRIVDLINYTFSEKSVPQALLVSEDEGREKSVWPFPLLLDRLRKI